MEVPVLVQVCDGLQNLVDPVLHAGLGEVPVAVLDLLIQVLDHVLEDEVKLVVLAYHLLELHHVGVVQLPKRLHLPQRHALVPAVELALHLLDRHHLVRLPVCRLPYTTICPIPELF